MHVSLDGFVAGLHGEMDWINISEELFDFAGDRTKVADTALYGRKTWEMMEAYWPTAADRPNATKHDFEHSAWYNRVEKLVVSRSLAGETRPLTTFLSEDAVAEISRLKQGEGQEIVIFGSPSVGRLLLQEGLVDDLWLFANPVLLGEGIPMFPSSNERRKLNLVQCMSLKSGVACLHYEVKN